MTSTIHTLTIDCASPAALATFWAAVLDQPATYDEVPGDDDWASVGAAKQEGFRLLFLKVPEPKAVKNRLHLDLTPDTPRAEEVERIAALGGTVVADFYENGRWTVMRDPEGNEFCVLRSLAEKEADGEQHDE